MAGADDLGIVVDGDDDVALVDHALSMMRPCGRVDANGLSRKWLVSFQIPPIRSSVAVMPPHACPRTGPALE